MPGEPGASGVLSHRCNGRVEHGSFASLLPSWREAEHWLVVTPHDDDPAIAAAMILHAAVNAGVRVSVRIVADGSMGYTPTVGADSIVETRRNETLASFACLGIDDVGWYGYPDAQLHRFQGRWVQQDGDPRNSAPTPVYNGYTGIQDSLVRELRTTRPDRVLTLAGTDLHPDHRVVFSETRMSIFHATGDIWPDCGEPLGSPPPLYECAAYSPFAGTPDWQYRGTDEDMARKLQAIAAYRSQTQVAALFASVREAEPLEHLRTVPAEPYTPGLYAAAFAAS